MKKSTMLVITALTIATESTNSFAGGRDYIEVVGSLTVYPFATVVAETFGKKTEF